MSQKHGALCRIDDANVTNLVLIITVMSQFGTSAFNTVIR